jgi:mono/diheme cytochrome c family protein
VPNSIVPDPFFGRTSTSDQQTSDIARQKFEFSRHLKHGQAVYLKRCVQCHGVNGDGNGPAAEYLYPKPRDYTKGIFKFTSTPYGSKPRREDLIRTLRKGITGTSMPAFNLLPEEDIEAVVDYITVLSQRGELELQLYYLASDLDETEDLVTDSYFEPAADESDEEEEEDYRYDVDDTIATIIGRWEDAEENETQPLTPLPLLTDERVARGREAFLTKGCSKCHGEDGRGHTPDNIGKDTWGNATRAADLTSGMLHGGQRPIDVYRRILNGINGTPMPGFSSALASEPENDLGPGQLRAGSFRAPPRHPDRAAD